MAEHILKRVLTVHRPMEEVFAFFANASNLERITPAELNFKITSPRPIEMRAGALIDYQLSLYGIPMNWRTEITVWEPPNRFVDTQLKGPYSQWVHTHKFTALDENTTLIEDEVKYRLPFEPLGEIANFIVGGQLKKIFDHRQKVVEEILGKRNA
ncbi:MAG: SRPBCC family protein [Pyrinomonadaceae bacterium]